jgi:hypothetical protein
VWKVIRQISLCYLNRLNQRLTCCTADGPDVAPEENFHYGPGWTAQQVMQSFQIKKRPVFDLISVSSGSSARIEGKGLEEKQSNNQGKELMGPVNIETILRGAWKTQFGQAGCFVSARVEEVGLPSPLDFIPVSLNIERRNL